MGTNSFVAKISPPKFALILFTLLFQLLNTKSWLLLSMSKAPFCTNPSFLAKQTSQIPPKNQLSHSPNTHSRISPRPNSTSMKSLEAEVFAMEKRAFNRNWKKTVSKEPSQQSTPPPSSEEKPAVLEISEDAFEKELLGMTGGFPGGEKGLEKFIEENPPPKKGETSAKLGFDQSLVKKPKPPELPMLLPGMIAIVKNPNNPFYMYCGIVQRITDGKAGVLFEGGNWDRLITFRLDELERREKGPPMVNPRSAILEETVEKSS